MKTTTRRGWQMVDGSECSSYSAASELAAQLREAGKTVRVRMGRSLGTGGGKSAWVEELS